MKHIRSKRSQRDEKNSQNLSRRAGIIAVMIVMNTLWWLFVQWFGGQAVVSVRYMIMFDLIALAIFFVLICAIFWFWRNSRG